MCTYLTIKDFGPSAIKHEVLPLAGLRSDIIKQVSGGLSGAMRIFLRRMLLEPGNITEGFLVTKVGPRDGPALLFLRLEAGSRMRTFGQSRIHRISLHAIGRIELS